MKTETRTNAAVGAFDELECSIRTTLETYSNVHRGSGQNSAITTRLFEEAREVVLDHAGLPRRTHEVVFCSPHAAEQLLDALGGDVSARVLSSETLGLPLGVRAVVAPRGALRRAVPAQTGGGTARLVGFDWVVWGSAPDRFEAGTPAIVNVIAFAQALRIAENLGPDAFRAAVPDAPTAPAAAATPASGALGGRELLGELRASLVGRDVRVPAMHGLRRYVNLDNGASTPTFEPVWKAARAALRSPAESRREIVESTRATIAAFLGAPADEYDIVFTANTTEAINLVAESARMAARSGGAGAVANTLLEHNSNELPWRATPELELVHVDFDSEGFIDLAQLEAELGARNTPGAQAAERIGIVAVSGASNVLGVYNDLAAIARIAHAHGARLLVDAAQLVAHRAVDMSAIGIDYLAFSGHKAYAPFGTGVLVARRGLLGFDAAELQRVRESGEENAVGIAALGEALTLLSRIGLDVVQAEEQALTRRLLAELSRIPGVTVYGISDPQAAAFSRKGGVIPFNVKGTGSHRVAAELAARGGIGVRAGCHCAHLTVKRILGIPPWVQRLQRVIVSTFPHLELPGVARISLGIENTDADVDAVVAALAAIASGPRVPRDATRLAQSRLERFIAQASESVFAPIG